MRTKSSFFFLAKECLGTRFGGCRLSGRQLTSGGWRSIEFVGGQPAAVPTPVSFLYTVRRAL